MRKDIVRHTCLICNNNYSGAGIAHHLRKVHNIEPQYYWIKYINEEVGHCKQCNAQTKFISIFRGYLSFCSNSCKSTYFWLHQDNTERCKKISKALFGISRKGQNKGRISPMKNKKHSQETKDKIGKANSISLKGNIPWNAGKQSIKRITMVCAYKDCASTFEKAISSTKKYCCRKCWTLAQKGEGNRSKSLRVKNKISLAAKIKREKGIKRKKCSDEDIINRMTATMKALNEKRPTSYEKQVISIIKENSLPYKYVGDGSFWITSEGKHMNPDFLNTNGKKKVIEVFEEIHKILQYGSVKNYIKDRKRRFGKFGFEVVFITGADLKQNNWKEICLQKIT